MRRLSALLVLVALLSAGCVGKDEGAPSTLDAAVDRISGPTEAELRATPGSIEGLVLTPDVAPIAGARVTLLRENQSVVSDARGFFRFEGLANGAYLVTAEAEGYAARTVQASATNGTVYELNFTLLPQPALVPFTETRELAGFLACGAEADAPHGRAGMPCSSADPNHRDSFEVDLMPDVQGLVLELTWDAEANPGMQALRLVAETVGYGAHDETLGEVVGEGGYARVEVPAALLEKYYPEGGRYRALVTLVPAGSPPVAAAFQAPFTLYASAFHHEAAPAGFSVFG